MKEKKKRIIKPPVDEQLLNEVVRRMVKKVKPEKIILFGSYAYGKPTKDSDLDFFIIKNTKLPFSRRFGMVSDAIFPRLIPMDFIVKTPKEVQDRLNSFDPFIKEVLTRGKVLYERKRLFALFCERGWA